MLKFSKFALLSALLAFAAGAQAADDKPEVLVNGVSIPKARVDLRVKSAAQQGQPESEELRKAIREDLINLEVISQTAVKNGLDKQGDTVQQLELARQSILAGAFVQDYVKNNPVSVDAMKQEYEAMKARVGNKEFKLSHILVESEDEAKKAAAEIKKGAKFGKVAKSKSKDPGSKDNGGDLGWAVPSNFVQPFAEAVTKLAKGQISAPVQTQFGWHIIKLEDTRELKVPTFEEMKPQLEKRMQQQAIQKLIEELRGKAKIE
ncbi:MAG: peptidylprolyl isomerase [Nitrosomonadales bacterium]|nr:peptidylprolyl isomerase [Nitrosomonadales bacterium]